MNFGLQAAARAVSQEPTPGTERGVVIGFGMMALVAAGACFFLGMLPIVGKWFRRLGVVCILSIPLVAVVVAASPNQTTTSTSNSAQRDSPTSIQIACQNTGTSCETFHFRARSGYGTLRIQSFIPSKAVGLPKPLAVLGPSAWAATKVAIRGDGRGFDAAAPPSASRVVILVDFDRGEGEVFVNFSCWASPVRRCKPALPLAVVDAVDNAFPSTRTPAEIYKDREGRRTTGLPANEPGGGNDVYYHDGGSSIGIGLTATISVLPLAPPISASFRITPRPGSDVVQVCRDRVTFPALEIYQDVGGATRTVSRVKERDGPMALSFGIRESGCETSP